MSMDFSEFRRRLGAEPKSRDPDLLRARESGPEFAAAAAEADEFEARIERALSLPVPAGLAEDLRAIPGGTVATLRRRWLPVALAATVLLAVGAVLLNRDLNPRWESVEAYVVQHYYHDGVTMLAAEASPDPERVRDLFAHFDLEAAPELEEIVGVIKICVTPDGNGIHMVLTTETGPVTVIYMPGVGVEDHQTFAFDDQRAVLVQMPSGSAAVVVPSPQDPAELYAFVQNSIRLPAGNG